MSYSSIRPTIHPSIHSFINSSFLSLSLTSSISRYWATLLAKHCFHLSASKKFQSIRKMRETQIIKVQGIQDGCCIGHFPKLSTESSHTQVRLGSKCYTSEKIARPWSPSFMLQMTSGSNFPSLDSGSQENGENSPCKTEVVTYCPRTSQPVHMDLNQLRVQKQGSKENREIEEKPSFQPFSLSNWEVGNGEIWK